MIGKNLVAYLSKLFIVLFIFWTVNALAETITLVTGDFAPYSGKDFSQGGMTTEIIVKAFKEVGYTAEIEFLPWKRGIRYTKMHKFFGTFPYVADDERKKEFLFSKPIYAAKVYFFVRSDSNIKYEKDEDLQGLTTCVPLGWSPGEIQRFLDKKILNIGNQPIDDATCFQRLKLGRVDLYPTNEVTGWYVIKKTFGTTKDFRTIGKHLQVNNYYIIVDKTYPNGKKLLEQFNKGLKLLKQKGIYQEIIEQHLGK